jgi:hypothetical protein
MRAGRYWMRLSRFLTIAASWSTLLGEVAQAVLHVHPDALGGVEVRGVGGQLDDGQPVTVRLGEPAHRGADVGIQIVPDQDDRGMQLVVRGGDQARRSRLRTWTGARPCARGGRGGRGRGRAGALGRRA